MAKKYYAIIDGEKVEVPESDFLENLYVEQADVPTVVTMRQAKIQLSRAGLLGPVNEFIENMEGQEGDEARIEWEYAMTFSRNHPMLNAIGQQFNLTAEQIDGLFVEAAKIE